MACRAIAAEVAGLGQVSILVNDAGINRRNAFAADPDAVIKDWQDIMAVNLNGVFNVTHAFLSALRATKGRIVNVASVQSFMHVRTPSSSAYTTSKHGVLGFTRALAAELGKEKAMTAPIPRPQARWVPILDSRKSCFHRLRRYMIARFWKTPALGS